MAAPGDVLLGDIVYACRLNDSVGAGLCVMNSDGTGQRYIDTSIRGYDPAVSPDGTRIAFVGERDYGNQDIFVMNADGSGVIRLTTAAGNDGAPSWSPDGTKITFWSDRTGDYDVYVVNVDGTGETNLTNTAGAYEYDPVWSPDGTRIAYAFASGDFTEFEIYVMNADGSSPTRLTNTPDLVEDQLDWSPDGTRIAYRQAYDIYVMNADGTGQTNLTNTTTDSCAGLDSSPSWSPDGTRVVYEACSELFVINADGSARANITNNPYSTALAPDWHPLVGPPPPPPPPPPVLPPVVEPAVAFGPATTYPTGPFNPWQVAVADFNGDGIQDLAVATPYGAHPEFNRGGEVVVMLGTGGGRFGPATHLAAGEGPRSVAVGDFNRDGIADLAVANSGSHSVSLLMGRGDGTFAPAANFPVPETGRPHMLVVHDFNGDGFDDVAVAAFEPPPNGGDVHVLFGTGTGALGPAATYHTGFGTSSIAVGDFNKDGLADLVVTNLLGGEVQVLYGTGGGPFAPAVTFGDIASNPNIVAVGDFNGDGFDDLAVTTLGGGVAVSLNDGTGSFGAAQSYPAGTRPFGVTVGDFNGDGRLDLAVANAGDQNVTGDADTVSVLLGTGTGGFGLPTDFAVGDAPFAVAVGDFNGDTWPDLAVGNNFSSDVSVLLNTTVPPAPVRPVASVTGSAYGYYTNVGVFGEPRTPQGPAPTVTLGSGGGTQTATDPDGATAVYGPANIFEASGPLSVATKGTTGPHGYVTSSTLVSRVDAGPFTADHVASSCTASGTATASTALVNGVVVLNDPDPAAQGEAGEEIVQLPTNPSPDTEYSGTIANVNDRFRIVFNEQATNPDGSITVNAVHMYLLGPIAVGDLIIGHAECGVTLAPPEADLSVRIAESAEPAAPRASLTYTVTVTNNGRDTATGVSLLSTLSGVDVVSATSSTGTCNLNGPTNGSGKIKTKGPKTISCQLGDLARGASQTVTIVVATPAKPGQVGITSTVSSTITDPNPANNTAIEYTTVHK